jgi:hypothetical protein
MTVLKEGVKMKRSRCFDERLSATPSAVQFSPNQIMRRYPAKKEFLCPRIHSHERIPWRLAGQLDDVLSLAACPARVLAPCKSAQPTMGIHQPNNGGDSIAEASSNPLGVGGVPSVGALHMKIRFTDGCGTSTCGSPIWPCSRCSELLV